MTDKEPQPAAAAAPAGRTLALWGLLGLQTFCAFFFVLDVAADIFASESALGGVYHEAFEFVVVVALVLGIAFTGREIRKVLQRQQRMESQLKAAAGAFAELLDEHFEAWALTDSERDVALLAIKGLSIAEIASIRRTKEGTIKAQCTAIYRKAGVTGRPQLLSLFIEELMAEGLVPAEA